MSELVIQWPLALVLLIGIIPLWRLLWHARRQREEMVRQFGGKADGLRRLKDHLRLVGIFLLLLALARPGIDPQRQSVVNLGRDVVFVLDVSQSMLAEDAAPSRLEVAKQGVRDALKNFQSARVGLVIYAGSANILCPLTHDYDFVRYMLEQATPRSVDFGGTQLISAIEKTVDQVFSEGRAGYQDMVLLTDGEDHAAEFDRIADLLKQADAGLLVVGVGDAERGARIPVAGEEGKRDWLRYEGQPVETKLNRQSLQQLTVAYRDAHYEEVGTAPFDLGAIYLSYARQRPAGGSDEVGDTIVVYREVGFFLLSLGLSLLLLAEFDVKSGWRKLRPVTVMLLIGALLLPSGWGAEAVAELEQSASFDELFKTAVTQQQQGKLDAALETYYEIRASSMEIPQQELAVVYFNMGLCRFQLAHQQKELSSSNALADVRGAQLYFLKAKQLVPNFERAGRRLDSVAVFMMNLQKQVEAEEKQDAELNQRVQEMLQQLQLLVEAEQLLLQEIPQPVQRRKKNRQESPLPVIADPPQFSQWPQRQQAMTQTGLEIQAELAELDQLTTIEIEGMPPLASVFKEPLSLMENVVKAQQQAIGELTTKEQWPLARRELSTAVRLMQEILQMLSSQNSSPAEEGDEEGDMGDEEWDMSELGESDESQSSSMPMNGDMAQTSEMQPLPKPNYLAEEILGEEMENQQFRSQKRSAAQAGKVEKDW